VRIVLNVLLNDVLIYSIYILIVVIVEFIKYV
jgi:hypothetical protein